MARLRAHVRTVTLFGVLLACGGVLTWYSLSQPADAAMLIYLELSEQDAAEIDQIRRDLSMDGAALACLDLSEAELDLVLSTVRTWHGTNAASWRSAQRAVADQAGIVRHIQSELRQGRGEVAELQSARATLAQRETEYEGVIDQLRQLVLASWAPADRDTYANMTDQPDLPLPFRALDLTQEQSDAVAAARRAYRARMAVELPDDVAAAERSSFEAAVASAIGSGNQLKLAAINQASTDASVRVVASEQRVLPVDDGGESE